MFNKFGYQFKDIGVLYSSIAVFLLGAIALIIPSGYSVGSGLLLIGSFFLIWFRPILNLKYEDKIIMAILAIYSLIFIAQILWEGGSSRALDRPSRFLLAIPVLLFILAYPPKIGYMWAGLALGSILTGSWALWQNLVLGIDRASGFTLVIQFGNISMLFGIFCLAGLGWANVQNLARWWAILLILGAFFGILASLLSGSRGGWVGFPFIFLVLNRAYGELLTVKFKITVIIVLVILVAAVYFIPQTGVELRVSQAIHDISLYFNGGNKYTSTGLRFDMWQGALKLIYEKPITGWGWYGYYDAMQDLANKGEVTQFAAENHAHNEFLDNFARRGLIGILTLLLLYLVPLRLFAKRLSSSNMEIRAIATAGVILPVAYMDFGFTQVFFGHNSGVMVYAFWLPILWGTMRSIERKN